MAQAEVLPEVTKFLEAPKMLIGGKPTDATRGETFETIDPSTGKGFAEVPRGGVEDVDAAVAAAREAFEDRRWSGLRQGKRTEILYKLGELIKRNISELAQLEALDSGKPVSLAQGEMWVAGDVFRYYAGWPTKFFGETNPSDDNSFIFTLREPVGVCGGIIPWNFPMVMASWKVAPALACGNTVVLKPAEQTPLTAMRLAELALEAGIPEGVFSVVTGSGSVIGEALVKHPLVRKIAFTGSTEVGINVMRLAADDVKRVSLELGGKSPNLIFEDADFDKAVDSAASSSLGNAGQDCCARSRILVQQSIYDRFSKALVEKFGAINVGNPLSDETEMGPLVTTAHRERVMQYIESGKSEGATLACGGRARERGAYLEPTVFLDATSEMTIVREEIFGPVVAVMPFRDEAE